jgi:hypothetical protein
MNKCLYWWAHAVVNVIEKLILLDHLFEAGSN